MASPLFDSNPIFDSVDDHGTNFTEGCLSLGEYTKIRQTIHFNGEQGDRYLFHGYGDRQWEFKGLLCAPSLSALNQLIATIQTYIDKCDESTYFALTDSYGNTWTSAQIVAMSPPNPRRAGNISGITGRYFDGYVTDLLVRGTVVGMQHEA